MNQLEDRKYATLGLEKLLEFASYPEWHLDKAHAIYELACRSLADSTLLPAAWRCIGAAIEVVSRLGTPLGQPAAAYLLDSGAPGVEETMVQSMREWTTQQQADFFIGLFQKRERRSVVERLKTMYGFVPKIDINEIGDVSYDE